MGAVDKLDAHQSGLSTEEAGVNLVQLIPAQVVVADLEGMAKAAADPRVKAVLIQRSKGYSTPQYRRGRRKSRPAYPGPGRRSRSRLCRRNSRGKVFKQLVNEL